MTNLSFCTYYNQGVCRSCDAIELSYDKQLQLKETKLLQSLNFMFNGELEKSQASEPLAFRNKIKVTVTGSVTQPIIGLSGHEDLDEGREILNCPLHHPKLNLMLELMPSFISSAKIHPYSIKNKTGELKGIVAYYSTESDEMYVRFVLRSEEAVTRIKKHLPLLLEKISNLKVVTVNIQPIAHALLEGPKEIFLTESTHLQHRLENIVFRLHPQGFVQTNQAVALKLYQTAAEWLSHLSCQKFLELYCGQGAFSFFSQSSFKTGLGIEINSSAVAEANSTARDLKLTHLNFISADASKVESELMNFDPDVILVNPPRRGLDTTVELLLKSSTKWIIYSSCDVDSLQTDLRKLQHHFFVKRVQLFDMFPHTNHFETLVLLQRL